MDSNQTEAKRVDDGGPAFPHVEHFEDHNRIQRVAEFPGMTLRDWFAGQALPAFFANQSLSSAVHEAALMSGRTNASITAAMAYEMADAMLAARKGGVS